MHEKLQRRESQDSKNGNRCNSKEAYFKSVDFIILKMFHLQNQYVKPAFELSYFANVRIRNLDYSTTFFRVTRGLV